MFQEETFYTLKGLLLQRKRRPFVSYWISKYYDTDLFRCLVRMILHRQQFLPFGFANGKSHFRGTLLVEHEVGGTSLGTYFSF